MSRIVLTGWLIDECGADWTAEIKVMHEHFKDVCSSPSISEELKEQLLENHGLTPLQLAVVCGCPYMVVETMIRRQTHKKWEWGDQVAYTIDLTGIDSAELTSKSVMELIGRYDAKELTRKLVLDEFMQGFIFNLFKEKRGTIGTHVQFLPQVSQAHCAI